MADNSYGWFGFIGKIVDFLKYLISFFAGRSDAEKKRKEEEDRKKAEQAAADAQAKYDEIEKEKEKQKENDLKHRLDNMF